MHQDKVNTLNKLLLHSGEIGMFFPPRQFPMELEYLTLLTDFKLKDESQAWWSMSAANPITWEVVGRRATYSSMIYIVSSKLAVIQNETLSQRNKHTQKCDISKLQIE